MDNSANVPRKPKRVPLPGQQAPRPKPEAPFREEIELFGKGDEQDRLLEKKLLMQLSHDTPPSISSLPGGTVLTAQGTASAGATPGSIDSSLVSSLTSRLNHVEKLARQQKEQLHKKDEIIAELRFKNEAFASEVEKLKETIAMQRSKIGDMENFLGDYGLKWRGKVESDMSIAEYSRSQDQDVDEDYKKWVESIPDHPTEQETHDVDFSFDIRKLLHNIEELNILAGEGTSQFHESRDGSYRLKQIDPLVLTIHRNGFRLQDGPFRFFSKDPSSRSFINDIMDGYFPYELKERYPDGIPFKVRNFATSDFESPIKSFYGQGMKLGGEAPEMHKVWKPASSTPVGNVKTTDDAEKSKPLSRNEFLNKLPKTVVKNGEIIDVRKSIGAMLGNATNAHAGPEIIAIDTKISELIHSGKTIEEPLCTLRIKTPDVDQIFSIQLKGSDTVMDVRTAINMKWKGSKDYELRVSFPAKVLSDEKCTLAEAGLVPNASLHMGF